MSDLVIAENVRVRRNTFGNIELKLAGIERAPAWYDPLTRIRITPDAAARLLDDLTEALRQDEAPTPPEHSTSDTGAPDPDPKAVPSAGGLYDGATSDPTVAIQLARIDALEARLTCVEEALAKANAAAADAVALHDRVFAKATETMSSPSPEAPEPLIERFYDGAGIDAVVTFPCADGNTSVRVVVRVTAPPHEKVGVTDARIIAEARKVLAMMASAPQGAGE